MRMERQAEAKPTVVDHKEFGLKPQSDGKQSLTKVKQKEVTHPDFTV